jgi:hypothetical protein
LHEKKLTMKNHGETSHGKKFNNKQKQKGKLAMERN